MSVDIMIAQRSEQGQSRMQEHMIVFLVTA